MMMKNRVSLYIGARPFGLAPIVCCLVYVERQLSKGAELMTMILVP